MCRNLTDTYKGDIQERQKWRTICLTWTSIHIERPPGNGSSSAV